MCIKLNSMKIVGIENKTGDFQGRTYNNYVLHCLEDDPKVVGGLKCSTVKFKAQALSNIVNLDEVNKLVGKEVLDVYYDKYGNASGLKIK